MPIERLEIDHSYSYDQCDPDVRGSKINELIDKVNALEKQLATTSAQARRADLYTRPVGILA